MRSMIGKNTLREIKNSLGRYIAILAIVALGVGFFAGLKVTKPVMLASVGEYVETQKLYDYRLVSTLGFTKEDVEAFADLPDAQTVAGSISKDVLYQYGDGTSVMKVHMITDGVNECEIVDGRMPQTASECVVDSRLKDMLSIGDQIVLSEENETDTLDIFAYDTYTITGFVVNPYYMNFERGTTSLGNGKVSGFMYIPAEGFDFEYYTEILIKYNKDFQLYAKAYDDYLAAHEDEVSDRLLERVDSRYAGILEDANGELADARAEVKDAGKKLADAKQALRDGEQELIDGQKKLADGQAQLAKKKSDAQAQFQAAREKLAKAEKQIRVNEKKLSKAQKQITNGKKQLATSEKSLTRQAQTLTAQQVQLENAIAALEQQINVEGLDAATVSALRTQQAELTNTLTQVKAGLVQVNAGLDMIRTKSKQLAKNERKVQTGKQQLVQAKKALKQGRQDYQKQYAEYEKQIKQAQKKLDTSKRDLTEGEQKLADSKKEIDDGDRKLAEAQDRIEDGEQKLADIPEPESYVLGRDTNIGYVCFESDSDIVNGIANVFPVFFFLVAALVCITTMNRMVDEHRTQIGVLKALGYSESTIMGKYTFYAGSSALIGAVLGFVLGSLIFPYTIWWTYQIMYSVPHTRFVFAGGLAVISLVVALVCSVGTTVISCYVEFMSVPAALIRPKAPKSGKRILLEHIPVIWKRIPFLHKVSIRNVLRYKKRFLMMVLGISGCTALLVTGLGLKDSIANFADSQYDKVMLFDLETTLSEPADTVYQKTFQKQYVDVISDNLFISTGAMDLYHGDFMKSATVSVVADTDVFSQFIDLHTKSGEPIIFPGRGEAVITNKLADKLNVKVGDTVSVRNENMQQFDVRIAGIAENFVYNYIYMSEETYVDGMGEAPAYKTVYSMQKQGADIHEIAADVMDDDKVAQVSVIVDVRERLSNMTESMNFVVLLVIVCAGLLAFIVLYNLTNINITERIREIATIKVLGFYAGETAQYVFRENVALTAIGALVGLPLGKWLHAFVMYHIDIDMVAFDVHVSAFSYVLSIVITFLFALLVDGVMYFKLNEIHMAESLKSIE